MDKSCSEISSSPKDGELGAQAAFPSLLNLPSCRYLARLASQWPLDSAAPAAAKFRQHVCGSAWAAGPRRPGLPGPAQPGLPGPQARLGPAWPG